MSELNSIQIHFSNQGLLILNIVLAFIMFGISLELTTADFTALLRNKKTALVGLCAHFILLPLLTFCLVKILHPSPSVALGMILVGACPGGNMSNLFTHFAKGNTALAVGLTSVSHLLAILLTPFNFSFYGSLDSSTALLLRKIHLSVTDVLFTILLVIVIPLVAGMLVRKLKPAIADRINVLMKRFSLLAFAIFLIAAFAGNARVFISTLPVILPLVVIHNAVALSAGYLFASAANLELRDRKTITFETGVQNSGLGLILIFNFFNGMGGMALVAACWGVWHLISGGTLAYLWHKRN